MVVARWGNAARSRLYRGTCAPRRHPPSLRAREPLMVAEPQFLPSGSDVSVDRRGRPDPRVGKIAPADARSEASPSKDFGGLPPIEQGEGDSILAAFSRATDAVAA